MLPGLVLVSIIEETSLRVLDSGKCSVSLVDSLLSVFAAGSQLLFRLCLSDPPACLGEAQHG